jgi:hypothetical protein
MQDSHAMVVGIDEGTRLSIVRKRRREPSKVSQPIIHFFSNQPNPFSTLTVAHQPCNSIHSHSHITIIIMPQGSNKLSSTKKKSVVSQKRQAAQLKTKTAVKRNNAHSKHTKIEVTKKINKKIESEIAAKAVSAGINFKFDDLKAKGEKTNARQLALRNKKQLVNKRRTQGADGQYSR